MNFGGPDFNKVLMTEILICIGIFILENLMESERILSGTGIMNRKARPSVGSGVFLVIQNINTTINNKPLTLIDKYGHLSLSFKNRYRVFMWYQYVLLLFTSTYVRLLITSSYV